MAYTYKGSIRDMDEPTPNIAAATTQPTKAPVKPGQRCGSTAGYKDHQNYGEEACARCKDALAAYSRAYRARVRNGQVVVKKAFSPERCGSYAGYAAHKRYDVPPCPACLVAHADYMLAYRAARKAA